MKRSTPNPPRTAFVPKSIFKTVAKVAAIPAIAAASLGACGPQVISLAMMAFDGDAAGDAVNDIRVPDVIALAMMAFDADAATDAADTQVPEVIALAMMAFDADAATDAASDGG